MDVYTNINYLFQNRYLLNRRSGIIYGCDQQFLNNVLHLLNFDPDTFIKWFNDCSLEYQEYAKIQIDRLVNDIYFNQTFTITFGDQAENHVGMQKLGQLSTSGFNYEDLKAVEFWFSQKGFICNIINLHEYAGGNVEPAYFLIIKKGLNAIVDRYAFYHEQDALEKDTKVFMYGRVCNKHARHNLCFSDFNCEPNYEQKQGRVYSFMQLPLLNIVRNTLGNILPGKSNNLVAEGNYYHDLKTCGIGFHGDAERKKVIGVRIGASFPMVFQWYYSNKPIGNRFETVLDHGDIYFMSEKAVGTDWKRSSICTLRHAAGASKFINK